MSNITPHLKHLGRRMALQELMRLAACHIGGFIALLLALEGTGCIVPLRELTVSAIILTAGAVSFFSFIPLFCLRTRRLLQATAIARAIEHRHPELKDALNCAVGLEQKTAPLNPIEKLLLTQVQDGFDDALPRYSKPVDKRFNNAAAALALSAVLFIAVIPALTTARKFHGWLHDGVRPGIVLVAPADGACVPIHSDIAITAAITRWSADAVIHYESADGTQEAYPMHAIADKPRHAAFTLFDIARPTRFRITTAHLSSPWYSLSVYDPPEVTAVTIAVDHQPYTQLKPEVFHDFQDISAVEGDAIRIDAAVKHCLGMRLRIPGQPSQPPMTFEPLGDSRFRCELAAHSDAEFEAVAVDSQGGASPVARFAVSVRKDMPPIIERIEPQGDMKLKVQDAMRLASCASDDFGITSFQLKFRIVGRDSGIREFAGKTVVREVPCDFLWELSRLNLQPGDMISCMLTAQDNHPPVPHTTRSEPFFISIIPDLEEVKSGGDAPDQEEKVDISDLIAESKRIIRLTWDLMNVDAPLQRDIDEAVTALKDLALEVSRRQVSMQEKLQAPQLPPPFGMLFKTCLEALEKAVPPVQHAHYQLSIAHQEDALAQLLRMENELMQNKAKSDKAKAKNGEKSSSDNKEQQQKKDDKDNQEQPSPLPEAIQKLRDIVARQDAINAHLKHRDAPPQEITPAQQIIKNDTDDVMQSLNNLDEAQPARARLQEARNEMSGIAASCRKNDLQTASIHGTRAQKHLLEALAMLEALQRKAEAEAVKKLAEDASRLAQKQREEAQASQELQHDKMAGKADAQKQKDARTRQNDLARQTQHLQKKLRDTAEKLEDKAPETARELRNTADDMDRQDIHGKQRKAANALLYKRFDTAQKQQKDAADALQKLGQAIQNAAGQMPAFTLEQLKQQLQQLQKLAQQTQNGQQSIPQGQKQLREQTQHLAEMLKDKRLQELSQQLSNQKNPSGTQQSNTQGSPDQTPAQQLQALLQQIRQTMDITVEHILKLDRTHKLELNRETIAPPDKYRRLVQEYFKDLGK